MFRMTMMTILKWPNKKDLKSRLKARTTTRGGPRNIRWVILSTMSYDVAVSIGKYPILVFIYLNTSSSCFSKS